MTVLIRWARRRLAVVVLTCALVTVITVLVAPTGSSSYTAEARFLVATGASSRGPGSTNEAITGAQVLASAIPTSDGVLSAVPGLSQEQVADRLKVTTDGNGQVIVQFTDDTAAKAQTGAYDIARALSAGVPDLLRKGVLTRISTPSARTTTASHPTSAATHLLIGLGIGLLLGVVLAVAWDRRDRRVDEPEDLARVLDTAVTSLTTLSEWQARGLRQRWLSADATSGVVALVSAPSRITDPSPWLYAEFDEVAGAAGLRLIRTTDRLVKNLAAVKTLSGTTLLFAGTVGTEGAVAGMLVADATVVAVTEGTPARDVLECRRRLAQQGVVPRWALIVPRSAARAAERAEQRAVRSNRPRPGDGRQVPPAPVTPAAPVARVEPVTRVEPAAPVTPVEATTAVEPVEPTTAVEPVEQTRPAESRIVLEPPNVPTGTTGTTQPAAPTRTEPAADAGFGETTVHGRSIDGPAVANPAPGGERPATSSIDADLEQLLAGTDQPARRTGRSVNRRSRSRAR